MDISQNQQNSGGPPVREWLWRLGIGSWLFVGIIAAIVVIDLIYVKAHHVLIPLIVAFIIGILLEPLVNVLMRRGHFPRWLAVVVTMFIIIAVIVGFFAIVIYGISTQAHQLAKQVQEGEARLRDWVGHMKISSSAVTWVTDAVKKAWPSISDGITHAIGRTASGLGSFAIGMFIGFFILIFFLGDDGRIKEFVAGHLGLPRVQGESVLAEVTSSFRGYFKGATIIAGMNVVVVVPVLLILRVPLIGAISLVTFVTCYIPSFGGYIGGAFAVFIALASRGLTAGLIVLAFSIVAHTILQAPVQAVAYGKTLQLHPLVALLMTLFGAVFAGIAGAILAVPLTAVAIKVNAEIKRAREEEMITSGVEPAPSEAVP